MRIKWRSTLGVAAAMSALVAAGPVSGQQQQDRFQQDKYQQDKQSKQDKYQPDRQQTQVVPADDLLGARAQTRDGQRLGQVEDIIIDLNHGQAALMVISLGDEAQRSGEVVAIPFDAAKVDAQGKQVTLDVTRSQVRQLRSYRDAQDRELSREATVRDAYRNLNRQPYWERDTQVFGFERDQQYDQQRQQQPRMDQQQQRLEDQRQQQQFQRQQFNQRDQQRWDQQRQTQMRQQRDFEGEQYIGMDPEHARDRQRAQWQIDRGAREQFMGGYEPERVRTQDRYIQRDQPQQRVQQDRWGQQQQQQGQQLWLSRLDDLQDLRVESRDGRQIAEIEDVIINTRDGRIAYVILDYEGARQGERAAVPFAALRPNPQQESLALQADRQQLDRVAYRAEQRPNFEDEQWARQVHQEFRQEQAFQEIYAFPREDQQRFEQQRWQQQDQQRFQDQRRMDHREQRIQRRSEADYTPLFRQARQERLEGEVIGVSRLQARDGREHTMLVIESRRDGQISFVDVGSRSELQQRGVEFRPGQQVNVTGQRVAIIQATELETDSQRIQIEGQQQQRTQQERW